MIVPTIHPTTHPLIPAPSRVSQVNDINVLPEPPRARVRIFAIYIIETSPDASNICLEEFVGWGEAGEVGSDPTPLVHISFSFAIH